MKKIGGSASLKGCEIDAVIEGVRGFVDFSAAHANHRQMQKCREDPHRRWDQRDHARTLKQSINQSVNPVTPLLGPTLSRLQSEIINQPICQSID